MGTGLSSLTDQLHPSICQQLVVDPIQALNLLGLQHNQVLPHRAASLRRRNAAALSKRQAGSDGSSASFNPLGCCHVHLSAKRDH